VWYKVSPRNDDGKQRAMAEATSVVVITGGGRGIGAATARLAARRGWAVCVNYLRDEASAAKVVGDIVSSGGKAIAVRGNVAEEHDVMAMFDAAARLGNVRGMVNNAGILERQTRRAGLRDQHHRRISLRARSGAPHVDAPWRRRRLDRERVVHRRAPRRARRVRRLRGLERRHRHDDRRPREGSRRGGDSS
jgi:NAD(P)-dependent dehydrogenase (short-subunit alcohol dehydrogenase family)